MGNVAYVEYETGMVWVEFDYDAELIEELKAEIPSQDRTYDGSRKMWGIIPSRWDEAKRVLEKYVAVED